MTKIKRAPAEFLDGAPDEVLDVFLNEGQVECYTVWVRGENTGPEVLFMALRKPGDDAPVRWGFTDPRWRPIAHRMRWADLPDKIKVLVRKNLLPSTDR